MTTTTGRFDYLDGIRAVAIGAVLALHWLIWYVPVFRGGAVGVDVFFVLSGFIITTMLWRAPTDRSLGGAYAAFVRRRVVRLYPALVGLVVGAVVLYAVVPAGGISPLEVARRGLLVLAQTTSLWAGQQHGSFMLPAIEPFGHGWSLAVEWYFYLFWPLLVMTARRRGWTARRTALLAGTTGAVAYAASLPLGAFWFYFGPTARVGELLAGATLALALQARPVGAGPVRLHSALPGVALVLLGIWVVLGVDGHQAAYRWVGVPLGVGATVVLILGGYAAQPSRVTGLLGHRWVAGIGRASYSLYLWHIVPFLLLAKVEGTPKVLLGVIALALTVALTALSYRFLEKPFLRARSDVLVPSRLMRQSRKAPSATRASSRSSADVRL